MNWEIVGTLMASLGGASFLTVGLAHFLGKVWADRIAQQTAARYTHEFELLRSKNDVALEAFRRKSDAELMLSEQFGDISKEIYQDFLSNRVRVYSELLKIRSRYITDMHEDFLTVENERWGDVYYLVYSSMRTLVIENQLYISNELEKSFSELRVKAAEYTREADMEEGYAMAAGASPLEADEKRAPIHLELAQVTGEFMQEVFNQMDIDISKLRSRIEIDRTN